MKILSLIFTVLVLTVSLFTFNESEAQVSSVVIIDSANVTATLPIVFNQKVQQVVISNLNASKTDSFRVYGVYAVRNSDGSYTRLDTVDVSAISSDLNSVITNTTYYTVTANKSRSFKITDPEQFFAILVKNVSSLINSATQARTYNTLNQ
jgi:hypothetical protein